MERPVRSARYAFAQHLRRPRGPERPWPGDAEDCLLPFLNEYEAPHMQVRHGAIRDAMAMCGCEGTRMLRQALGGLSTEQLAQLETFAEW